jgi:signal transduction histidine kinase
MSSLLTKVLPRGIGLRFTLWFAALFTTCSVLALLLAYVFVAGAMRHSDRASILAKSRELGALIDGLDVTRLAAALSRRGDGDEEEFYVRATDPTGRQLYLDEAFDDLDEFTTIPAPRTAGQPLEGGHWNEIESSEHDEVLELYGRPLAGGVWLEVGRSSEEREEVLTSFRAQLPWVVGSMLAGGVFVGVFFTSRALRPIRELGATVRKIKAGHISARVPVSGGGDELDQLKTLFNEMLDQVQGLIEGMRRTTDALAHDIRTPLARLRAGAELSLAKPATAQDMREALMTAIESSEQLVELTEALLDVSEAEAKALALELAPVDVHRLLATVVDLYQLAAEDVQVTLEHRSTADPDASAVVHGDLLQLRRVVANLVDNAVKYTPPGGHVALDAAVTDAVVIVRVTDTGIGIPEAELPHIWSRLFRGDLSRSKRGMGLGLSLVRAIVEAHGGRVTVQSRPGEGSTFEILLPRLV